MDGKIVSIFSFKKKILNLIVLNIIFRDKYIIFTLVFFFLYKTKNLTKIDLNRFDT